jgi:hypothetical protein
VHPFANKKANSILMDPNQPPSQVNSQNNGSLAADEKSHNSFITKENLQMQRRTSVKNTLGQDHPAHAAKKGGIPNPNHIAVDESSDSSSDDDSDNRRPVLLPKA